MARFMKKQVSVIEENNKSRFRTKYCQQKHAQAGGKTDQLSVRDRFPFVSWHIHRKSRKQANRGSCFLFTSSGLVSRFLSFGAIAGRSKPGLRQLGL
jgi:hypothetical protein